MTLVITHPFVSGIAEGGDPTLVGPNEWNANHTLTGTVSVAQGGSGITSGTSGGVLYFSGSATLASSGALTANAIVLGGGAGAAPTSMTGTSGGVPYFNASTTVTSSAALASGGAVIGGGAGAAPFTDAGFTYTVQGQVTLALGTITTNKSALTITGTWNASGVTFDAPLFMNITPTASALGSALIDVQQAGVSNLMLFNRTASAASPTLTIGNSTNPTQIIAYNTVDTLNNPTNYERGVFDWTTNPNLLSIGTQVGGTGTARNVKFVNAGNNWDFNNGSSILLINGNISQISIFGGFAISWGAGAANTTQDVSVGRVAAKVLGFGDSGNNANGWMQWAGQTRVTSDVTFTSTTVLGTVTGLSVNVQAGRTYAFESQLFVTDAAAGGVQAAIAGTCTATNIQYTGWTVADNAIKAKTNATALGTAVASTTTTETAGIMVQIYGTITVNAAGTLLVQAAQNTSNGTATTIKRGSYFYVYDNA